MHHKAPNNEKYDFFDINHRSAKTFSEKSNSNNVTDVGVVEIGRRPLWPVQSELSGRLFNIFNSLFKQT